MSSFIINVSMKIQVSHQYSNIEMHAALNKRIFKLSFTLCDLNIDLCLAKSGDASPIRTWITRSVDQT